MTEAKLRPSIGVRTAQVFTVSTVLGSAEGERCQAGPRFSPPHNLPSFDLESRKTPSHVEKNHFQLVGGHEDLRRGQVVELILDEETVSPERCSVVWVGKAGSKHEGEVGLETV